jgi:ribonuclease VapC
VSPPSPDSSAEPTHSTKPASGTQFVVDASAILALLFGESGAEHVADVVATGAAISAVNVSEVAEILARHPLDVDHILDSVTAQVAVEPFALKDARAVATLAPTTRRLGLSLADRACLALAQRLRVPVVTADRDWLSVDLEIEVQLIRRA